MRPEPPPPAVPLLVPLLTVPPPELAGLRRALRMTAKAKAGERLPYLLSKLKAPRVLERLEQTAALAREQKWPYEQFLESLLEAGGFARDASGARVRMRHASFPPPKALQGFDWTAPPAGEEPPP